MLRRRVLTVIGMVGLVSFGLGCGIAVDRGQAARGRAAAPGAARRSYLTALYRAQAQRSVDGVLQAAEGFAALGDRAAVQNCLVMATRLADDDPQAQASIQAFSDRFMLDDAQRRVSSSLKRAATIPSSPGSRLNGSTATSSK